MSEHAKGRLRLIQNGETVDTWSIWSESGRIICYFDKMRPDVEAEAQASARRLMACWNACLPLSTATLEGASDLVAATEQVERNNSELIECLREMNELFGLTEKGEALLARLDTKAKEDGNG